MEGLSGDAELDLFVHTHPQKWGSVWKVRPPPRPTYTPTTNVTCYGKSDPAPTFIHTHKNVTCYGKSDPCPNLHAHPDQYLKKNRTSEIDHCGLRWSSATTNSVISSHSSPDSGGFIIVLEIMWPLHPPSSHKYSSGLTFILAIMWPLHPPRVPWFRKWKSKSIQAPSNVVWKVWYTENLRNDFDYPMHLYTFVTNSKYHIE